MPLPYEGQRGWRVVVVYDETSMQLDPSLPPPWWAGYQYAPGDLIVYKHHLYRCRTPINWTGNFEDEQNRAAWVDITGGATDVREQLPDAVGVPDQEVTVDILPNRRLYVDTRQGKVNVRLAPPAQWSNGDIIEIVDDYRQFDKNPCTVLANGVRINAADPDPQDKAADLPLDVVGNQDIWRFTYYVNRGNPADQWLYTLSAPTKSDGGSQPQPTEKKKPVLVTGPADQVVSPDVTYIADTSKGPINFSLDEQAFQDGDTFTVMDFKWTFGQDGKAAVLKSSPTVTYQDGDPTDGNFYMNTRGPTSSWPFMYYAGVVLCMNAPLDQQWINAVTAAINGETPAQEHAPIGDLADPGQPQMDIFSTAQPVDLPSTSPASFPTFTTVKVDSDVDAAAPWAQYDVDMGRKKTLTIYLPPVPNIPPRSRIRVRIVGSGQGVINVQPDAGDQILGLFGNLNATPKGKPRTVHGQYAMIELESDGQNEWMVV